MNKMKRTNSEIFIREVYPPIMQAEALSMESEIEKIFSEKTKTDKRYIGGLICAGIVVILIVIAFSVTFVFAIIPAVLVAFFLGQLIGRRWKRQTIQQSAISHEKKYEMRLSCILIYLKNLKKNRISLPEFQGILEKAFEEFLPALVLRIHSPRLETLIQSLCKFLKSNSVHACMLNAAAYLDLSISLRYSPSISAIRLRRFFIPVMHLLKQPSDKENQELEVVRKISEILQREETHLLLCLCEASTSRLIRMMAPFTYLSANEANNYQACKAISDISAVTSPDEPKVSPTLRLYRRNSCSELYPAGRCEKKEQLLAALISASRGFGENTNFSESSVNETKIVQRADMGVYLASPSKSIFAYDGPSPAVNRIAMPRLFEGDIADLDRSSSESSESDNELAGNDRENFMSSGKSDKSDNSPYKKRLTYVEDRYENTNAIVENVAVIRFSDESIDDIAIKVHPFIDCFETLLGIEAEENSEKTWRQVVDKPETKVFQKKAENTPICMIKAFCKIKYSARTVYTAIWETDIRTKWDTLFHEFRLIDKQPDFEVLYYMIKTPFGITRRDWLQRRVEIHDFPEPGTIILHFISIDHPKMPPNKGIIRAETVISGYIIRPSSEDTCTVTIISQNDIKGLIPKALVNSVSSKAPVDWVNSMNKGCKLVAGY